MLNIFFYIAFGYLGIWTAYLGFFSILGVFHRPKKMLRRVKSNSYAVIVPAYKEDAVIIDSVSQNLKQFGSDVRSRLFVVADSLSTETLQNLSELNVTIIPVHFDHSTKAKAINEALKHIYSSEFSHTVILDADNIMDQDFFAKLEAYPNARLKAAQVHRTAKNQNSSMAILDSLNEEMGNHIFRKGHVVAGLSSALIGSGMVFETELFKSAMQSIRDTASEDKMLEFGLLERGIRVSYLPDVLVFDEKVSNAIQFEGQRSRWVAARFFYLKNFAWKAWKQLLSGNFDYFNKWLQFLLPQKILLLGSTFLLGVVSLFNPAWIVLGVGLVATQIVMIAVCIPGRLVNAEMLKSALLLPVVLWKMLSLMLRIRKIDTQKFNVTEKGQLAS
ncbi:MAG: glycosyltransferase [Flavobacteriia bacterium]|nr:glycosyltransferase [Flavobacteriia bacterium]